MFALLHTVFPKLCTTNYRWVGDDLICKKCGKKIGFRFKLNDEDTYRVFVYSPYDKLVEK